LILQVHVHDRVRHDLVAVAPRELGREMERGREVGSERRELEWRGFDARDPERDVGSVARASIEVLFADGASEAFTGGRRVAVLSSESEASRTEAERAADHGSGRSASSVALGIRRASRHHRPPPMLVPSCSLSGMTGSTSTGPTRRPAPVRPVKQAHAGTGIVLDLRERGDVVRIARTRNRPCRRTNGCFPYERRRASSRDELDTPRRARRAGQEAQHDPASGPAIRATPSRPPTACAAQYERACCHSYPSVVGAAKKALTRGGALPMRQLALQR
jgi:hypothetical protein